MYVTTKVKNSKSEKSSFLRIVAVVVLAMDGTKSPAPHCVDQLLCNVNQTKSKSNKFSQSKTRIVLVEGQSVKKQGNEITENSASFI